MRRMRGSVWRRCCFFVVGVTVKLKLFNLDANLNFKKIFFCYVVIFYLIDKVLVSSWSWTWSWWGLALDTLSSWQCLRLAWSGRWHCFFSLHDPSRSHFPTLSKLTLVLSGYISTLSSFRAHWKCVALMGPESFPAVNLIKRLLVHFAFIEFSLTPATSVNLLIREICPEGRSSSLSWGYFFFLLIPGRHFILRRNIISHQPCWC